MFKYLVSLSVCSCVFLVVNCDSDLNKEVACEWEGIKGKCVSSRTCLTSLDEDNSKQPPCSQNGDETFICCTDCELVNDTSNYVVDPTGGLFIKDGRKTRDRCLEYLKVLPNKCYQESFHGGISRTLDTNKNCHTYNVWAIGGSINEAERPSKHPYEAIMGFGKDLESATWMTSGTIISEKFILTSAVGHSKLTGKLPLKFAALGVRNRKEDKKKWQIRTVKKIYHHPSFETDVQYDNIALLELASPINFNKVVLPACLPDPSEDFDIETAKTSSWKNKETDFSSFLDSPEIMEVKRLEPKECEEELEINEAPGALFYHHFLPRGVNGSAQLCYGDKDTCLHTTGSAVVVTSHISRCMYTVIGVNAYGNSCGPVVYSKVAAYVPWIESIVWPEE